MFAYDCKIYKNIQSIADQNQLQEDIDRLCGWSKDWLLKFNIQKCKIVSYGNETFHNIYSKIPISRTPDFQNTPDY